MLCILYVNLIGALLGAVGVLVERALPAAFSRRWMWCVIIAASIAVPGYYRFHHNVAVSDVLHAQSAEHGSSPAFAALDPAWWAHTESYDDSINRFWLISSVGLILWGAAGVARVAYLVHTSRRRSKNLPTIVDGVRVVVTDSLGPATVGFWRSRVLVPQWVLALSGVEQRYIVRHEEEHRRAHDAHLLFVASLPILLMPWNLALWWQVRRMCLAVEIDCDNRVVTRLGDPAAYGELLLKVAESASRGPRLQPALLGMGSLERRLTVLVAPARLRHLQRFLLPAALALLVLTLSLPHPVVHHPTHGKTHAAAQAAVRTARSPE